MIKELTSTEEIKNFFRTNAILSASIKITRRCNLHCKHCYVNTNSTIEELSLTTIKKIIDQLAIEGCQNLFLNGGEPFLRRDLVEIFSYAASHNMNVSISSNGMMITSEILKSIAKYCPHLFQISIDGPQMIHNSIRGDSLSFDRAVNALKLARQNLPQETQIVLATTIMCENINSLEDMLEIAKQTGVNTFCLVPLMPSSEKVIIAQDVPPTQKANTISKIVNLYLQHYKPFYDLSLVVPPGLIPDNLRNTKFGEGYLCTFPGMLGIDINGNIAPCDGLLENSDFSMGNIVTSSINELLQSPIYKKLSNIDYKDLEGVCSICKFTEICQGGCRVSAYNKFNSFVAPDPICQEFFENGFFPISSIDKSKLYRHISKIQNNK